MPGPSNTFLREGDYWTIRFRGAPPFRLKDTKGLGYLATMLRSPGREFHVLELAASAGPPVAKPRAGTDGVSLASENLQVGDLGDSGEVIDAQAKASYRRRLLDLHQEVEEAEAFNDLGRKAQVQAEIDALEQQLSAAFGLGGRSRKAGSAAERARVNARNTIVSAMKQVATHSPDLADHLRKTIRTGTFCWYAGEERWDGVERGEGVAAPGGQPSSGDTVAVMIVDDHPMWRQTLRAVLEGSGVGTVVAESGDGDEAVAIALETRPQVVLMDMNLPTVDGVEATGRLLDRMPETKVLILSSSDERADVIDAVRAGASGYLVKTAEPDEVADAVQRIRNGELVFPPALARVVLEEFRRMSAASGLPAKPTRE